MINSSKQLMADIVAQLDAKKWEISRILAQFYRTKANLHAIINSMPTGLPHALFTPKVILLRGHAFFAVKFHFV